MGRIITCLFLVLFCLQAYGQRYRFSDASFSQKYIYVDSVWRAECSRKSAEEVSAIFSSALAMAKKGDDKELMAMLELELIKAGASRQNDEAKQLLKDIYNEYGGLSASIEAEILQATGDIYYFVYKRNSISFEYYLKAYEIYKDMPSAEFPGKQEYLYSLAGSYYRYDDFTNTVKYMRMAVMADSMAFHDITVTAYNTIGLCYRHMGVYDSSLRYFELALNSANGNSEKVWTGILSGNIGATYYQMGRVAEAIDLLEKNVTICMEVGEQKNAFTAECALIDCYLEQGNIEKASSCWKRLNDIDKIRDILSDFAIATTYYKVGSQLNRRLGNMESALVYADSALVAKDSASVAKIKSNNIMAQEKVAFVQRRQELDAMIAEKGRQTIIRNSLIGLIALAAIIGILIINRSRLRQKQLVAELDAATLKLINYSRSVNEKDEIIDEYNSKLEHLQKEEDEQADINIMAQLEGAILLTDEQWDDFRRLFEKVHKGFFANLRKKHPDLTPSEVRFMALSKLNLSPKEMASMLGVSPSTIRIYKYRIRKKLNLDKDDTLEHLV